MTAGQANGSEASASLKIRTVRPEETQAIGEQLAEALRAGDFVALYGELGAGKTVFVQGLAVGLQAEGRVASPTFIIMRRHPCRRPGGPPALYHVDAYRLNTGLELWEMGLADWAEEGVIVLEWADHVPDVLPEERLEIHIAQDGEQRELTIIGRGLRGRALRDHLRPCAY